MSSTSTLAGIVGFPGLEVARLALLFVLIGAAMPTHVLHPASPNGWRLVVRQAGGMMPDSYGWGVYVRNPGFIRLGRTHGGWDIPKDNLNFAYDPFKHGTSSLSWDGATGGRRT